MGRREAWARGECAWGNRGLLVSGGGIVPLEMPRAAQSDDQQPQKSMECATAKGVGGAELEREECLNGSKGPESRFPCGTGVWQRFPCRVTEAQRGRLSCVTSHSIYDSGGEMNA